MPFPYRFYSVQGAHVHRIILHCSTDVENALCKEIWLRAFMSTKILINFAVISPVVKSWAPDMGIFAEEQFCDLFCHEIFPRPRCDEPCTSVTSPALRFAGFAIPIIWSKWIYTWIDMDNAVAESSAGVAEPIATEKHILSGFLKRKTTLKISHIQPKTN